MEWFKLYLSASTTFEDVRYDSNDMLAFVASMDLVNNNDCDSDDDELLMNIGLNF